MSKPRSLLKGGIQSLNVGEVAQVQRKIHFEAPQSKEPQIEVSRKEHPHHEGPQLERGLLSNFFPLSFEFFSHPQVRNLSGDGFRVYLWLNAHAWQFPNSRGEVQASIGRVSRETGVSEASVSRILAALQKAGLVRLIRSDFKYGNVWRVEDLAKAKSKSPVHLPPDDSPHKEVPQNKVAQSDRGVVSNCESSHPNLGEQCPQNEGEVISKIKQEIENSLSFPNPESSLSRYLQSLKPQRKRESESECLKTLLGEFSVDEVELGLSHLLEHGIPGSGERCHSPLSYLSHALPQVLARARERENQVKLREEREEAERRAEESRMKQERCDEEIAAMQERAFVAALPTQAAQSEWIEKIAKRYPVLQGCGGALRNLAISAWASENKQEEII